MVNDFMEDFYMKKKFLLLATTLLVSSVCLYGCGEDKNNNDTVVEQTEVVEVQDQAENEDVASTGDFASKNYEYNHVFDDIINEAPIIDTDFLQMTSNEQIISSYGLPDEENGNTLSYCASEDGNNYINLKILSLDYANYYFFSMGHNGGGLDGNLISFLENEAKWNIEEDFVSDYCSIGDNGFGVNYLKDDNGYLVKGHTYEEIVNLYNNKGMLMRIRDNEVAVVWYVESANMYTSLRFDIESQQCVGLGF